MNYPVQTRTEAEDLGQKRYFTGKVCLRGHTAQRFVSTGACVQCCEESNKATRTLRKQKHITRLRGLVPLIVRVHHDQVEVALQVMRAMGYEVSDPAASTAATITTEFQMPQWIVERNADRAEAEAQHAAMMAVRAARGAPLPDTGALQAFGAVDPSDPMQHWEGRENETVEPPLTVTFKPDAPNT